MLHNRGLLGLPIPGQNLWQVLWGPRTSRPKYPCAYISDPMISVSLSTIKLVIIEYTLWREGAEISVLNGEVVNITSLPGSCADVYRVHELWFDFIQISFNSDPCDKNILVLPLAFIRIFSDAAFLPPLMEAHGTYQLHIQPTRMRPNIGTSGSQGTPIRQIGRAHV